MHIVCSFDDASLQDLKVADLIIKYGLENNTTFYFPVMASVVNEVKGRISLSDSQQEELAEIFEIGSHTITHRLLTRIPPEEARREIFESKELLALKFNQPITKFCYPRGYANPEIQSMVSEAGYESARSTLVGYIHKSENRFFQQTAVHVGCDRKEYGGKPWYQYALYMLEQAKNTPDSVFHIFGHGYEIDSHPNGFNQLEDLLRILANEKV